MKKDKERLAQEYVDKKLRGVSIENAKYHAFLAGFKAGQKEAILPLMEVYAQLRYLINELGGISKDDK